MALIGQKIQERDAVEVDQTSIKKIAGERVYLLYYKPLGIDTHDVPRHFSYGQKMFPIGRLDKNSHGLIILTNDGRITDRMLNPKYEHEKEYLITVDKKLRPGFLQHLREGVKIDDYVTKPAKVHKSSDHEFRITLTEGRHHQIRRMCDAFGYTIRDLKRVRIMNMKLGNLAPGKYRALVGTELKDFLSPLIPA